MQHRPPAPSIQLNDRGNWGPEHWEAFREQLEKNHVWPTLYVFKFIVPHQKAPEVRALFPLHECKERPSANGTYTSLTYQMMMPGSHKVVEVYQRVRHIEGLIAL